MQNNVLLWNQNPLSSILRTFQNISGSPGVIPPSSSSNWKFKNYWSWACSQISIWSTIKNGIWFAFSCTYLWSRTSLHSATPELKYYSNLISHKLKGLAQMFAQSCQVNSKSQTQTHSVHRKPFNRATASQWVTVCMQCWVLFWSWKQTLFILQQRASLVLTGGMPASQAGMQNGFAHRKIKMRNRGQRGEQEL